MSEPALNEEKQEEYGLTLQEKLDRLYALEAERKSSTADLDQQIEMLEAERTRRTKDISAEIARIEGEVKQECLTLGETVKGQYLQVVYTRGKEIFDTARLKAQLPDTYRNYMTTSKASVSIQRCKENKSK